MGTTFSQGYTLRKNWAEWGYPFRGCLLRLTARPRMRCALSQRPNELKSDNRFEILVRYTQSLGFNKDILNSGETF